VLFFNFVFRNLFGVCFFFLFRLPPPVFTADRCCMSGAPPEDGDGAEGRAPKRSRLNVFGELEKLYDAGLMAQKETHEQEMQALRVQTKETHEQEMQALREEVQKVVMENNKLRAQLQKRGGPVAVSNGSAVSSYEGKRGWMIYYCAALALTKDKVEDALPGLERIETVRLLHPNDQPSYVSLLYFKDPEARSELFGMLCEIIRSKICLVVHMSLECTSVPTYVGDKRPYFMSIVVVEMRGMGPDKEKILRYFRDWQKRGPYAWEKNEAPRFPFGTVYDAEHALSDGCGGPRSARAVALASLGN
jgi:hypothetical protein